MAMPDRDPEDRKISIWKNRLTEPEKRRIRNARAAGVFKNQLARQYRMSWETIEREIGK